MLSVIADIAQTMGLDKEEMQVTAQVAKAKLTDNMDIKLYSVFTKLKLKKRQTTK